MECGYTWESVIKSIADTEFYQITHDPVIVKCHTWPVLHVPNRKYSHYIQIPHELEQVVHEEIDVPEVLNFVAKLLILEVFEQIGEVSHDVRWNHLILSVGTLPTVKVNLFEI
jgi:hypothetical protein